MIERIAVNYTKRNFDIVDVEQVGDLFDEGATCPVKCSLSSGVDAAVKYMKNPFGERVLVNEFVGACISDLMGLTIPRYGLCHLGTDVIEKTNSNEDIDVRNAGIAFYTEYHSTAIPAETGALLGLVTNYETEKIILFDHIVNNCDRHNGNLFIEVKSPVLLYLIDNSHIITSDIFEPLEKELAEADKISRIVLDSNNDVYDELCNYLGFSEVKFGEVVEETKEILTPSVLDDIRDDIPQCWKNSVGNDNLDIIFKIIRKRIEMMDDIKNKIILEGRDRKWVKC